MITYTPLWRTMKQKGITQYRLIHTYHISAGQIGRLKKNEYVARDTKVLEPDADGTLR